MVRKSLYPRYLKVKNVSSKMYISMLLDYYWHPWYYFLPLWCYTVIDLVQVTCLLRSIKDCFRSSKKNKVIVTSRYWHWWWPFNKAILRSQCCYDDQWPLLSYYFKCCLPQLILGDHNVNKASELLLGYPCHHHTPFTIYFTLSSVLLNYYFGEVM